MKLCAFSRKISAKTITIVKITGSVRDLRRLFFEAAAFNGQELRSGPGKNYSALMAVAEGTELIVDGEQDDWIRVISPTGELAWVSRQVVET